MVVVVVVDSNRPRRLRACLAQAAAGCCALARVPGQAIGEGGGGKVLADLSLHEQAAYEAASGARRGRRQRSDGRGRQ